MHNYIRQRFKVVEKKKLIIFSASDVSDFVQNGDFHI